jgi:hypothetical protein
LPGALEAARTITDEQHRAQALAALAPHLSADLLPGALEAARTITDEQHRAQALAALAPHLSADLLAGALEAARTITDAYLEAKALAGLAPILIEASMASSRMRGLMRKEWHRILRRLGQGPREDLLFGMALLEPWSGALLKPESLADIAWSIIQVSASEW